MVARIRQHAADVDRSERLRLLQRQRRLRQARQLLIVACVAAAIVQVSRGNQSPETKLPAAVPTATAQREAADDWRTVLHSLDECRQELFRSRLRNLLSRCDAPGSAAWRSDDRALQRAIAQDVLIESLPLRLIAVEPLARRWSDANEYVQLLVRDRLDANAITVAAQQLQLPARAEAEWLVTLRRSRPAGDWRYFEIKRRPVGQAS